MLELPIPDFFRVSTPFTVYRRTDFVFDFGSLSDLSFGLTIQPNSPSKLLTTTTLGTPADFPHTITYTGTDEDDLAISEDVVVTGNGFKITSKSFKTVTSIGIAIPIGFTGDTRYTVQARDRGNEPIFRRVAQITNFMPSFQPTTNLIDKVRYPTSGIEEEAHAEIYFNRDEFTPQLRDIFSSTDIGDWEIINISIWVDSHFRLRAKKL